MSHPRLFLIMALTLAAVTPRESVAQAGASTAVAGTASSGSVADRDGVRRAALDYLEGFYEGDTAKLVRSVRPDVDKRGYSKGQNATAYSEDRMTWPEFLSYANSVKARNRPPNPSWPKEVLLLDVLDQTAVAKVTAWWGTDYLLMAKFEGRWMITQVIWQSPVRPAP